MKKIEVINKNECSVDGFGTIKFFELDKLVKIEGVDNVYTYAEPCDDYIHSHGMAITAAVKVTTPTGFVTLILNDTGFTKLPKLVQKYMIQHEVGHAVNGDLDNLTDKDSYKLLLKRAFGFVPKMEVKADCYAASVMGVNTAKNCIKFMIRNTNLPFNAKFELAKRCLRIK